MISEIKFKYMYLSDIVFQLYNRRLSYRVYEVLSSMIIIYLFCKSQNFTYIQYFFEEENVKKQNKTK